MKKSFPKKDIYQDVTNRIIEALENGCAPWVKPWTSENKEGSSAIPFNAISGANYNGVNTLLLWGAQMAAGFSSNTWMTFKQAKDLGGNVMKGEKSQSIIYYQMLKRKDEDGKEVMIPILKSYSVFNLEQTEGITKKVKSPIAPDVEYTDALTLAEGIGASVLHGGDRAFFSPSQDFIKMPPQKAFDDLNQWDSTLLHELTHWTGHSSRIDRLKGKKFGDQDYAFEELIAEIGSALLGGNLNIPHEKLQHAEYVQSWLTVLKSDKKAIFSAAKQAQKACDYILDANAKVSKTIAA